MKYIHLLNSNVYLTNLLLIPCVILSVLIYNNINKWEEPLDNDKTKTYSGIWLIMILILVLTIIFSNIHHFFMFGKNKLLQKIGNIDSKIMAPLMGIIILIMNIVYILYLLSDCGKPHYHLKKLSIPIFIVSIIYTLMGIFSFIMRKIYLPLNHALYQPLYITSHTFFHYMAYSGIILLYVLFYIENKEIYLSLFEPGNC